ncbi:double-strand break repair protein AddB [Paracoccus sp. S-4012]|uniref:double-strand break repair protein AddB n=1 Tax=Paracoccus sp. S-4012 TaxID=2665648 RepID=UPI0012B051D3|nr:double-strand break repair protein AddB [Paracoccus sp. S-4012]MRX49838.1 double-strand break repair protein AddB [Paracoccus sp. S-4012]
MSFSGLYALPPGVDFAAETVAGLIDRMAGQPPEAMARVSLWANSGRTLTALRRAFEARGPMLLPRMRPIADLGGGPLEAPLARELDLARLISGLVARRPALAGGQSAPRLARSLAALMAEMQSEGCGPDALDRVDVGDHAEHWREAQAFLRIAADWALSGPPRDREARQRAAAEAAAADWAAGRNFPEGPVIVAGSTGSHGATRLFMEAVAALPQGAVILPGFDFDQPEAVWARLDRRAEDHPQARFAPLLETFGPPQPWRATPAAAPARNRLVSLALRPAPVTDQWVAEGPALGDLRPAAEGLTLVEAPDLAAEARAIAVAIRGAMADERRVTLIAADRALTRRVAAELDRWDIVADDSAGRPLPLTPPGLFLRQVASLNGQALTIDALLALLKHPVTSSGTAGPKGDHLRFTRDLELHLRRHGPAFPDAAFLRGWPARHREGTVAAWADWLAALLDRIAPLAGDKAARPLPDRLAEHRALAEALAAGPEGDAAASRLWDRRDGALTRGVMDQLAAHAGDSHMLDPQGFSDLLAAQLQTQAERLDLEAHPLVRIRGPREARSEACAGGLVILAGLNEGSWPQPLAPDAWLSRPMRLDAGLTLPERVVGLAAHDFQQGIAAGEVILTRAARDAEAETVPSRWLNRLMNLMAGLPAQHGPEALKAMRGRGEALLTLARALATPRSTEAPAPRPAPVPPAPAFARLSVTEVATLIRDPYAIYARHVLKLRPLDPLHPEPDAALRGEALHRVAQRFLSPAPAAGTPRAALVARFLAIADEVLAEDVPWPAARAFWMARLRRIAPRLMADEALRLQAGAPMVLESRAEYAVPGLGVSLIARPDRIDLRHDGSAHVYDYKSGKPPTVDQIRSFDKQLPVTAALVQRGAFPGLGRPEVTGLAYISLSEKGEPGDRSKALPEVPATWDRLVVLMRRYLAGEIGFTARRAMEQNRFGSDYDRLSRFGEWSAATPPTVIRLGDQSC